MERISESFNAAYQRMMEVLFQPFDIGSYLLIALFAWLANCSNPSANTSMNFDSMPTPPAGSSSEEMMFFGLGVGVLVAVLLAMLVLGLGLWAGMTFLSSRGTMMWIDALVVGKPRLEAWSEHAQAANSLWRMRLLLGFGMVGLSILALLTVVTAQVGTGLFTGDVGMGQLAHAGTSLLVLAVLGPIALVVFVLERLVMELLAPVLYVEGGTVMSAAGSLRGAAHFELGEALLYLLLRTVVGVVVSMVMLPLLCLLFCLFIIPGMSTTVFLPVIATLRGLSLQWVGRLDPRFEVLQGAGLQDEPVF